jgi:hypothetical protein
MNTPISVCGPLIRSIDLPMVPCFSRFPACKISSNLITSPPHVILLLVYQPLIVVITSISILICHARTIFIVTFFIRSLSLSLLQAYNPIYFNNNYYDNINL